MLFLTSSSEGRATRGTPRTATGDEGKHKRRPSSLRLDAQRRRIRLGDTERAGILTNENRNNDLHPTQQLLSGEVKPLIPVDEENNGQS